MEKMCIGGEKSFNLLFFFFLLTVKPQEQAKPQKFYALKEGQTNTISIKFEANPAPTEGFWTLDGSESPVAFGAASIDGQYTASFIEESQVKITTNPGLRKKCTNYFMFLFGIH